MRVLFIFPDLASDTTNYTGIASYGVASLVAALRASGHDAALYHLTSSPSQEEFTSIVRRHAPDLVAFSVNSHYARRLENWAALARRAAGAPVVVGGIHPTLSPAEVSSIENVDFTCVGEGEDALVELCDAIEQGLVPASIGNLWIRRKEVVIPNPPRPLCPDLDRLADPDLSLFDFDNLYPVRRGLFPYLMSRGCGYGCSYCCIHSLRRLARGGGQFWRYLSPVRAATQLASLIRRYQPNAPKVLFLDTILFPDREWLNAFAPLYRDHVGRPFSCNMRADFIDEEVTDILADMGCETVRLGVESGNEEMTTKVLNRGLTLDHIRRAFALLRDRNIERVSYNMVGLPRENLSRALETVRLNAEIVPDLAIPFIFYPYPGTRLHQLCEEEGYLTGDEFDHYFAGVVTRMPGFPAKDILFVHRFFRSLVRLYGVGQRWPVWLRDLWFKALTAFLTSPLLPRGSIVQVRESYKRLRHRIGEVLVQRSPALYRLLGGTDPL